MTGVRRLEDRERVLSRPARRARATGETAEAPVVFEITRSGERIEGRAPGIDRAHLRKLRAGKLPVEARVDLHGLRADDARDRVRAALIEAVEAGLRCVLVIHGRGRGSADGPVLKSALPGWLALPPLGASVMAFASAPPGDGGAGATVVLLRRRVVRTPG